MQVLNPDKNLARFFERLRIAPNRALLLDYDGTLAPFTKQRDRAFPYPGVTAALEDIIRKGDTRLVIISGRSLDDLMPLLGLPRLPEIWGCHGAERLVADGTMKTVPLEGSTRTSLEEAARHLGNMGWRDRLERKPFSIALHWRGVNREEKNEMKNEFMQYAAKLGEDRELALKEFDGGLELRWSNVNKGNAVQTILAEMKSGAVVAYLGDDLTDEDAFTVLEEQETPTISVLVREELRETGADLWLRPPNELLEFLNSWLAVTSSTRAENIIKRNHSAYVKQEGDTQ